MVAMKKALRVPQMPSPFDRMGQPKRSTPRSLAAFLLLALAMLMVVNHPNEHEDQLRKRVTAPVMVKVTDEAQLNSPYAVGGGRIATPVLPTTTAPGGLVSSSNGNGSAGIRGQTVTDNATLGDGTESENVTETVEATVAADDEVNELLPQSVDTGGGYILTAEGETGSTLDSALSPTGNLSLREQLRLKSLAAKELIGQMLEQLVDPTPKPLYQHHQLSNNEEHVESKGLPCDQEDAFAGIPIDGTDGGAWVPPKGHPKENIVEWENAYSKAMQNIKEVTVGGDEFKEIAENEVQNLRKLRHHLFCGDD